jgi:transcriptional regulator with XRE-family HTH domain
MDGKFSGLRAVLARNRLQQKHVAEALDVSRNTVGGWADGSVEPSGGNLIRLLAYLRQFEPGLAVEELVGPSASPNHAA